MFEPLLLFCSCFAGPPADNAANPEQPFQEVVSDEVLETSGGGAGADLTRGQLRAIDAYARSSFRISGEVSQIQMDVWWGSTGAEMIAANVRAQL